MTSRIENGWGSALEAWEILGGKREDFPESKQEEEPEVELKEVRIEVQHEKPKTSLGKKYCFERNLRILDEYNFGNRDVETISKNFKLTRNIVRMILGLRTPGRSKQMLNDFDKMKMSREEIAEKYHVTTEYVRKILRYCNGVKKWNETRSMRERNWSMIKDGFRAY
jgi:Mor family transcriptional regulator